MPQSRLRAVALILCLCAFAVAVPVAATESSVEVPDGYARLVIITNFDNAEIRIADVSYPYEYIYGEINGVIVPSNLTFQVVVAASETQRRTYRLNLEDQETRVIVVDIENMGEAPPAPARAAPAPRAQAEPEAADEEGDEEEASGFLGVSSSPRGVVHIDGQATGQRTPARRIEVPAGRHQVQILYDEVEEMSEVKWVLIREGVNTNVFFRLRRPPGGQ